MSQPTGVGARGICHTEPFCPSILVVDDHVVVCELLKGICGDSYKIESAAEGATAVEILKQHPIDIIISDFRMPGMTGVELLGQAAELQPEAVRIMMSGYAEANIVIAAVNQGHIHFFLPKPFKADDVLSVLRRAADYGKVLRERRELVCQLEQLNRELDQRVQQRTAELREISEHRGLALEAAELGAWDYRLDSGDLYYDPRRCRMLGFTPDRPISFEESIARIHHEDREAVRRAISRAMAGENDGAYHAEFRVVWPDESVHWLAGFGRAYFDGEGVQRRAVRFIGVSKDITEQKFAEAELLKAKEAAEAADRAKSQFLANMSHEIRTPMNGVMGANELLLQTELTPAQQSYLEIARISGERMLEVINEILDFSKIKAHQVVLEQGDFDIRTTVQQVADLMGREAQQKGLRFTCQVSPDVPSLLHGDAGRISQILLNLAGNAIKFTSQGEVTIHAAVERDQGSSLTLRFSVADTGIGIRPDQQEIIFSPFVQADGSTTRKFGGAGLGLSISRQLLKLMGGQIGVESQEGKGSTFWFTVVAGKPLAAPLTAESCDLAAEPAKLPGNENAARRLRVLVAEDNLAGQRIAVAILEKLGYDADAVANGVEAIHALRQHEYAAVLMDCEMPGLDGYEATRLIRKRETGARDPAIAIIALTADAMPGDREECLRAGMNDYLAKPIGMQKLSETLATWTSSLDDGLTTSPAPSVARIVFDEESLLRRLMGDRAIAGELIKTFVQDIPQRLSSLRTKLEQKDLEGARFHAHALKGAAANLSASVLHQMAAEMQKASAANDLERSAELLPRVEAEFEEFKAALLVSGWTGWQGGGQV